MPTEKQQLEGIRDEAGRIYCPKCHRFCGKSTSEQNQHYCPKCDIEIITPQPSKALLIQEVNQTLREAVEATRALIPHIEKLT